MSDTPIRSIPLSAEGDAFHPNPSPARPEAKVEPAHPAPSDDAIGHYAGSKDRPPVYRREMAVGENDVIVCPAMGVRVIIPRTIQTWGELAEFLKKKFSAYQRTNFPDRD